MYEPSPGTENVPPAVRTASGLLVPPSVSVSVSSSRSRMGTCTVAFIAAVTFPARIYHNALALCGLCEPVGRERSRGSSANVPSFLRACAANLPVLKIFAPRAIHHDAIIATSYDRR